MDRNAITSLPDAMFSQSLTVYTLSLSYNPIRVLPANNTAPKSLRYV